MSIADRCIMNFISGKIGKALANYLEKPSKRYDTVSVTETDLLQSCLRKGDVLLVDGNLRISVAIKYITQSTWSHAAVYIGDTLHIPDQGTEPTTLIEADLGEGVIAVPLSKYANMNTRICRAINLTDEDRDRVIKFLVSNLGVKYDLKNVIDLMRYLLPTPPVPVRWRRRLLALGSGEPTRAICSTLIARAFQLIRYPILPEVIVERLSSQKGSCMEREIMHIRHHSLFTPRDFDVSPYFEIVKPTLVKGFDYKSLTWKQKSA